MLGFGFFAWDDLMQGHERFGEWVGDTLIGQGQIFRNWNDLVVILYGIAALIFLAYFLPLILSYPKFFEVLAIAFVFYILHTTIDSLAVDRTRQSVILEETCKLLSSANFACAMFVGLIGNVMIYGSSKN
jgi:hypothetical protein